MILGCATPGEALSRVHRGLGSSSAASFRELHSVSVFFVTSCSGCASDWWARKLHYAVGQMKKLHLDSQFGWGDRSGWGRRGVEAGVGCCCLVLPQLCC